MLPQNRTRSTVGPLIKAHTLRFLTMIAAWMLIFVAFVVTRNGYAIGCAS